MVRTYRFHLLETMGGRWGRERKSPQYAAEINTGRLRSNLLPSVFTEIVFEVSLHSAFFVILVQLPHLERGLILVVATQF